MLLKQGVDKSRVRPPARFLHHLPHQIGEGLRLAGSVVRHGLRRPFDNTGHGAGELVAVADLQKAPLLDNSLWVLPSAEYLSEDLSGRVEVDSARFY